LHSTRKSAASHVTVYFQSDGNGESLIVINNNKRIEN
jgi:hypothetical protein